MQKITACLWFNDQAEEAARFYTSIFKNSTIGEITHYGEGSPRPKGSVLTVRFQLDGQEFLALNGGPQFTFTEAVSFIVHCETQEELDRMWEKLSEGGEEVQPQPQMNPRFQRRFQNPMGVQGQPYMPPNFPQPQVNDDEGQQQPPAAVQPMPGNPFGLPPGASTTPGVVTPSRERPRQKNHPPTS